VVRVTTNGGPFRIAVVGGGFTGTMLATHLLRAGRPDLRVTLIEPRPRLGAGEAYRTRNPAHLLNVRASAMTAFPDIPDDFVRWLDARPEGRGIGPDGFAPRHLYADYLRDRFDAARAAAPAGLLEIRAAAVLDVRTDGATVRLAVADGAEVAAEAVALCLGNAPPVPVPGVAAGAVDRPGWINDPWADDALVAVDRDDPVLVIGTGLSMVDTVLALDDAGHRGPVLALSRRGLHPHPHADRPLPPMSVPDDLATGPKGAGPAAVGLLRRVRGLVRAAAARGEDWRAVIDGLRPVTQTLWRAASPVERARFLRHLRPFWDVHRHRIAPSAADRLASAEASGRLRIVAGRILSLAPRPGEGFELVWRPRAGGRPERATPRVVVNATGPALPLSAGAHPLLTAMAGRGLVRADALGLGIETAEGCRVVDAAGRPSERLFAPGPPDRGRAWETTAVPEIRRQVADLARRLTGLR
jgi:uncharacterized NAD(P)/FAD-binding protein YdhS